MATLPTSKGALLDTLKERQEGIHHASRSSLKIETILQKGGSLEILPR